MSTIIGVRMIMYTASAVVGEVRGDDQYHRRDQQPHIIMHKKELNDQKNHARTEQDKWPLVMMMFPVAVIERIRTDTEGKQDHSSLKYHVMDDIDAKQRKRR